MFFVLLKKQSLQFEAENGFEPRKENRQCTANTYANDVLDHDHATGFCFLSDAGVILNF